MYLIQYFALYSEQRRSHRRGPDGQEMHHINKLQSSISHIHVGRYSDEESDLPPAKRARDNNTVISDYEDMWHNPVIHEDRPTILTPPSLVSCSLKVGHSNLTNRALIHYFFMNRKRQV